MVDAGADEDVPELPLCVVDETLLVVLVVLDAPWEMTETEAPLVSW